MDKYSFCEAVLATSVSPWCVRVLTPIGQKFGGGVDTDSLCGRVQDGMGWDLPVPFDIDHPSICLRCLNILAKEAESAE